MNLSDNLKRIRKENNLSQEQLADKLGVSRQAVSKWESNQAYPEMDKVLQICKMFNLNIDELLNQNLKEVNETKQSKNNVNKFIDENCIWEWDYSDNPHKVELEELSQEHYYYPLNVKDNKTICKEAIDWLIQERAKYRN